MRTTLRLDDDVLTLAKAYAEGRSMALGRAVSELVRRGLAAERPIRIVNGFPVFDVPPGTPEVTTEMVKQIEANTL
jgi:hypothetical protein